MPPDLNILLQPSDDEEIIKEQRRAARAARAWVEHQFRVGTFAEKKALNRALDTMRANLSAHDEQQAQRQQREMVERAIRWARGDETAL